MEHPEARNIFFKSVVVCYWIHGVIFSPDGLKEGKGD